MQLERVLAHISNWWSSAGLAATDSNSEGKAIDEDREALRVGQGPLPALSSHRELCHERYDASRSGAGDAAIGSEGGAVWGGDTDGNPAISAIAADMSGAVSEQSMLVYTTAWYAVPWYAVP